MILVDTSAWVEFLRRTGSEVDLAVNRLLEQDASLVTTGVVLMEVLAGARDAVERRGLKRLLARCAFVPVEGPGDYERAADIYRGCRDAGESVRGHIDCLIAAVAERSDCSVLTTDADYVTLARHTGLKLA